MVDIKAIVKDSKGIDELKSNLKNEITKILAFDEKENFSLASDMCLFLEMVNKFQDIDSFKKAFFE